MITEYPHRSAWDDPNVKQALAEGRSPMDVALLCCTNCGNYGYYSQGSHFTCSVCDHSASGHKLNCLIEDGELMTLDDLDSFFDGDYPV